MRRTRRFLGEDLEDDDGVWREMNYHSPFEVLILDAQLQAARADDGHGPGVRELRHITPLKTPKEYTGLDPRIARERRSLDLACEPKEGLFRRHSG